MLQVNNNTKYTFPMRRKSAEIAAYVGMRIKKAMGDRTYTSVAKSVGVKPHTMWGYVNGLSLPGMDILSKISDELKVSIDWLIKGDESVVAKDNAEKEALYQYRETEKLMVGEQYKRYGRFLINEVKKQKKTVTE